MRPRNHKCRHTETGPRQTPARARCRHRHRPRTNRVRPRCPPARAGGKSPACHRSGRPGAHRRDRQPVRAARGQRSGGGAGDDPARRPQPVGDRLGVVVRPVPTGDPFADDVQRYLDVHGEVDTGIAQRLDERIEAQVVEMAGRHAAGLQRDAAEKRDAEKCDSRQQGRGRTAVDAGHLGARSDPRCRGGVWRKGSRSGTALTCDAGGNSPFHSKSKRL